MGKFRKMLAGVLSAAMEILTQISMDRESEKKMSLKALYTVTRRIVITT